MHGMGNGSVLMHGIGKCSDWQGPLSYTVHSSVEDQFACGTWHMIVRQLQALSE